MYVIFPADELLYMTYGIAVPRFKPRPTLDQLRGPLIPTGETESSPSPQPSPLPSLPPLPPNQQPRTSNSQKKFSNRLQPYQEYQEEQLFLQQQQQQLSDQTVSLSRRPSRNSNKSQKQIQFSESLDQRQYPTLEANHINVAEQNRYYEQNPYGEDYDRMTDYQEEEYMRERSPSIFLEPPTPSPNLNRQQEPIYPSTKSAPSTPKSTSKASKLRPKLNISLGRLGRQQPEQVESARLKEDLKLHVENPVFNRENLRQRNFDAFFESGEPVYSLQKHIRSPTSTPDELYTTSNSNNISRGNIGYSGRARGGGDSVDYYSSGQSSDYEYRNYNNVSSNYLDAISGGEVAATTIAQKTGGSGLFSRSAKNSPLSSRSRSVEPFNEPPAMYRPAEVPQKVNFLRSSSGAKGRSLFGWRGARGGSLGPVATMASSTGILKDYGHPNLNEAFKTHNGVTFKLVKTVSDFTETLSHLYEEHAAALQTVVSTYRKKNGDLRKERPICQSSLFQAWETFLQEIEADSQASSDVASTLSRQVSRPMLDRSFHRKVQSRKIFTHRESFETIIAKTEDKLSKCRMDYKQAYVAHRQNPTQHTLAEYIDAHNAYVQQLHSTNAMLETYHCETIPQLMQELEEIYGDLCSIVAEAVLQGADVISSKAVEQAKRYNSLSSQCHSISAQQDLTNLVRILPANPTKVPKRAFVPPQPPTEGDENVEENLLPPLKDELVIDRHTSMQLRSTLESLKREAADLEIQIRQLQDSVDTLVRTQMRGIENQLYNKANELQEDLSMKKFDLRAKQLHLSAIRSQVFKEKNYLI
ncbi:uncharacterized protein LOC129611176 [Condylostylus longicornis]|uniref:uncharacterized protein LOC129611176 n=1 Tax=Condylostylus longicornis TaxID=2530218 RepID=UPI00244DBB8A|nr:uncharacterized protein LOC129611176 [Condylostylus longicornis]XP_055380140.1 uncharacterized protein LOC129611176 [Condylostylus longicornis]XP_055380141.1 uncharacterized protein LOC129611176 [Condylostylus longicornis]XP_055380142.1 uncharacterized protein LOC129611176 [Condylostylus longicornis]XP_055380143.1 uncharacterized protein LOC129611176 [Condylostylus longicornis]XP_055380145.1 uncharacterized protein LOC129611176 [Condylostylus longicornis]